MEVNHLGRSHSLLRKLELWWVQRGRGRQDVGATEAIEGESEAKAEGSAG